MTPYDSNTDDSKTDDSPPIDSTLDLTLQRVIRAPRTAIWRAWTDPDRLQQWWVPAPTIARIDRLDVTSGGAFVTSMSEDGRAFVPHTDGIFLVVEPEARLVFTNAINSAWRPATPAPVPMTAEIVLAEHPDGTDYRVVVRHGDPADRDSHEQLGFADGWGSVTAALAGLVESEVAA
ncbi:SRPBCC domain-containing protein [Propionibacteriaceae bacterium Y2011]